MLILPSMKSRSTNLRSFISIPAWCTAMPYSSSALSDLSPVLYSPRLGFGQARVSRRAFEATASLYDLRSASAACVQLLRVLQKTRTL